MTNQHGDLPQKSRFRLLPDTHRIQSARRRGESGAIILLALAFLTIVLSLAVALLGLAQTENRSLRAYRTERVRRYNVDAALQEGVQLVKENAALGVTGTTGANPCVVEHQVNDDLRGGAAGIFPVTAGRGYITVNCVPTSGVTSGGIEADGGQGPRDVTFEVRCNWDPSQPTPTGLIQCGSGTTNQVLARARVRFDVDNSLPTTSSGARATVPKVISWSLRREGATD